MNLRAALLATAAAGILLFVAACGGGGDGDSNGSNASGSGSSGSGSSGSSGSGSGGSSGNCQPQTPTTIVGGDLFVADQGPVGMTLLSTGGFTQYSFMFLYDNVFGISTNNPQDKWGQVTAFPPGTPVGATAQVQLQPPPPDLIHFQPVPSTFPKGIPIELWLTISDPAGGPPGPTNSSSTASIGKDILGHDAWHTASVTYGANNTATVTFFASATAPGFSVSLTNVFGTGSPPSPGGTCM
ncbi:MAG TPA: hypothetical protein VFJ70_16790 [Burkholderiales bacterium]|nr:hypothetical protein [Burkholderiales bacterium]